MVSGRSRTQHHSACNRAALAAPCPSGLGLVSATSSMITCRQKFSLLFSLFWTVTLRCFNLKKLISNDADQLTLIQYIVRRLPGPRPCLLFPFPVWLPCLVLRPRVHIALFILRPLDFLSRCLSTVAIRVLLQKM